MREIIQNLQWTLEVKPDKLDTGIYSVYTERYGRYTKKEAEIICEFMRNGNILKVIEDAMSKEGIYKIN